MTKFFSDKNTCYSELFVGWSDCPIQFIENANKSIGFRNIDKYCFIVEIRDENAPGPFYFDYAINNISSPTTEKFDRNMDEMNKNRRMRNKTNNG